MIKGHYDGTPRDFQRLLPFIGDITGDLMRLTTFTLLVIAAVFLLIFLFPAVFLEAASSEKVPAQIRLQDPYQQTVGGILADASMVSFRPQTAAGVYDVLITRHPESSELYREKYEALLQAGDEEGALSSLNAAIVRDPQNPLLLIKKARILMKTGKNADAESIYTTILSIQTDNPGFLSAIADIALEKNQYVNAFDRYTLLLNSNPSDGLIWEKRSDVIFALLTIPTAGAGASETLRKTDLYTEGITGYQKALALNPERSSTIGAKIAKRSEEYVPKTMQELEERYQQYRYLNPGEKPLPK